MEQQFGLNKRETAEILKMREINPTTQRIEIAHYLLQKPQHLSAEEVLNGINHDYEQVSQATVYNTLRLFVEKGVLRELAFSPERVYYDTNTTPHHHFLDVDSGRIYDVAVEAFPTENIQISGLAVEVQDVSLLIRGRLTELPN
jgi:Fur family iron response transcriptional regulator